MPISDSTIALEIRRLLDSRAAVASICPSDVARSLQADPRVWRGLMPRVRAVAAHMASDDLIKISQRNVIVDPTNVVKGPIRLRRGPSF